jgi:hypothetical protein
MRSLLLCGVFGISVIVGCGPNEKPMQAGSERRAPTPAEAKKAIIAMLSDPGLPGSFGPGARQPLLHLCSEAYLAELKHDLPSESAKGVVVMGEWTCNLDDLTFTASSSEGLRVATIDGVFEKQTDGTWVARIKEIRMGHMPNPHTGSLK